MRAYDEKRDFSKTPEPGFGASSVRPDEALTFVVQRHEASRLHFDLRLEVDGVLRSWAVPKGPSLDPEVKRQAIKVEDHPLDYANFEGSIPKDQYGGGEVVIWDEGRYLPVGGSGRRDRDEEIVRMGLQAGKLSFVLAGHRLQGEFTLVRKDETTSWLLLKKRDAFATTVDPTAVVSSVRSGLTAEDLRRGVVAPTGTRPSGFPTDLVPMVASELEKPFRSENWVFEPKMDGIRVLAIKQNGQVRLMTRNDKEISDRFPGVAKAIRDLPEAEIVLDGELVLNDETGKASFQLLMDVYQRNRNDRGVLLWVFDLLYRNGLDHRSAPLVDRKVQLNALNLPLPLCKLSGFGGDGVALFDQAIKLGMEGIVGKRLASAYRGGTSNDWVKVKGSHTEEFLIGGFTPGQGGRGNCFGALMLGRLEPSGRLAYCGNVGTGFSDESLDHVWRELQPRIVQDSPFSGPIESKGKPTFVRPELVAEVRFQAWTREQRLRFPVFQRLRYDVAAPVAASPAAELDRSGLLDQIEALADNQLLIVDGAELRFTSLGKALWPGITKRDLLRYFVQVYPCLLRHFEGRPITFVRFPEGIGGESFYQRHFEKGLPEFVRTVNVFSEHNQGAKELLLIDNLPTLLWLAQIAAIELHPWHARVADGEDMTTEAAFEASMLNRPTYLACDLDPNIRSGNEKAGEEPELNAVGWARTVDAAMVLQEMLKTLGLRGFPKTTGKTGIHVFIPVERIYDHDQIREAARTIAAFMEKRHPNLVTTEYRLAKRPDKVFFDAGMNGKTKTLAGAYTPRPVVGGRVSFPLRWESLERSHPEDFTISSVPDLIRDTGDAWAEIRDLTQRIG